jgi:large subunit ribosomal protein L25
MDLLKISAKERNQSGKGPARRLRVQGMIPAVAYGKEIRAVSLAVSPKSISQILASERGKNTVLELMVEGSTTLSALLTDLQVHPLTRRPVHADFVQVHLDRPVKVDVPLELTGKAKGLASGGVLRQVFRKLPVRCLPHQIPVRLSHDVTELELNDHVLVSALDLPEGVTVRLPSNQTVAAVVTEAKVVEEEKEGVAAEAAATTATPAAAPVATETKSGS